MKTNDLEARMRRGEWFHSLTIPDGVWPVVRVDGRSFTSFTRDVGFEKPFDERFSDAMRYAAHRLLTILGGLYAFTESDEISVLLPRDWSMFDRELEKVVSTAAATASVTFCRSVPGWSIAGDAPKLDGSIGWEDWPTFDARVWIGATTDDVVDYFAWRAADAHRCGLNGHAYWTLRKEGLSARAATSQLKGATTSQKNELLFARGVNYNDLPAWQRRGVGLWFEPYVKEGLNPITQQTESAVRRRVRVEPDLPTGREYRDLVSVILAAGPVQKES